MKTPHPDGHGSPTVGLLGPSFDTGNMGVNALAEGSIKCLLARWPNAKVILLGGGRDPKEYTVSLADRTVQVRSLPIRYCRNIFRPDHFLVFALYGLLLRLLPRGWRRRIEKRNACVAQLLSVDLVADITAGDSFSDIYGLPRFLWVFSLKWLIVLYRKDLIMLPQTYGPYKKRITRALARYILNRARVLYARDTESADFARQLLGKAAAGDKVRFVPDVAFVLDPRKPDRVVTEPALPADADGVWRCSLASDSSTQDFRMVLFLN